MKFNLLLILIGLVAGFVGIIPLLKKNADKYFLLAAFFFYFMMPYVIHYLQFPFVKWWLKGAMVTLILSTPLVITAGKGYKRCIVPMLITSFLVGGVITFLEYYLI